MRVRRRASRHLRALPHLLDELKETGLRHDPYLVRVGRCSLDNFDLQGRGPYSAQQALSVGVHRRLALRAARRSVQACAHMQMTVCLHANDRVVTAPAHACKHARAQRHTQHTRTHACTYHARTHTHRRESFVLSASEVASVFMFVRVCVVCVSVVRVCMYVRVCAICTGAGGGGWAAMLGQTLRGRSAHA